jgi:hypothetical protein
MLIEFKCSNFRSIREEQTLSLVAKNTDKNLPSCIIERNLPGLSGLKYLKGAAIYGANASGKTNILLAIKFLSDFVRDSATKINPGEKTGAQPFKLDKDSASKPSKFEITFVAEDVRYLFGFAAMPQRVLEEYLVAYPKGVPQRWYERTFDPENQKYVWSKTSTAFKQDKNLQEKTRENSLFLSVGPQFNNPQLTQVFNWFNESLKFYNLNTEEGISPVFTAKQFNKEQFSPGLLKLLRSADFGVAGAIIDEKEITKENVNHFGLRGRIALWEKRAGKSGKIYEFNLVHKAEGIEPVVLDFITEESAGTRRFFALIGPWLDILEKGNIVFVDEIETSLHPMLVKELLKLLFCEKNNPKGAQIIFTTHNPVLLDINLIRRDQVWFTEKDPSGATHLYPLTDYQPRNGEALAKGYLAGRYGGIPFIPEGFTF